ncbi:unnamed protein product, partial [Chrysoparadoxa australica]
MAGSGSLVVDVDSILAGSDSDSDFEVNGVPGVCLEDLLAESGDWDEEEGFAIAGSQGQHNRRREAEEKKEMNGVSVAPAGNGATQLLLDALQDDSSSATGWSDTAGMALDSPDARLLQAIMREGDVTGTSRYSESMDVDQLIASVERQTGTPMSPPVRR